MMVMGVFLIKIKQARGEDLNLSRLYEKIQSHEQEMARTLAKLLEMQSGFSPQYKSSPDQSPNISTYVHLKWTNKGICVGYKNLL